MSITRLEQGFNRLCERLPEDLLLLLARFAVATVFWRSVQTKITGWSVFEQSFQFYNLVPSTFTLFEYEYGLPLISATAAAYLATFAEFFLSIFLLLGLGTRLTALALLFMTLVIQFFVYPSAWPTHVLWVVPLLFLVRHGGGRIALDALR